MSEIGAVDKVTDPQQGQRVRLSLRKSGDLLIVSLCKELPLCAVQYVKYRMHHGFSVGLALCYWTTTLNNTHTFSL